MGGKDKIRQKLLSVVEGRDKENVDLLSDKEIETWIQTQEIIPIDGEYPNDFPEYMKKNMKHLKSMGFIAE